MISFAKIISSLSGTVTSSITDKDIAALKENFKALNYELSLLRYKESDDEDIRLAIKYLKKRPYSAALFPYEKMREMPPIEVGTDKDLKMCYVMHNGHPLYFPKGASEKVVRWLYRYAIEDDDVSGNGYRQRNPHAYQSERYHIEEGDILIDAGGGRRLSPLDVMDDIISLITDAFSKRTRSKDLDVELDVGTPRGLFALDVMDKVSKVYVLERASRWWKPLEATLAPYMDKVELVKGYLSGKKKKLEGDKQKKEEKKKEKKEGKRIRLANLLEQCGQQRVFIVMDLEGKELEVLRDAQEYLQSAKNPITLAVCAYHHTTDYEELMSFFESIGYHTETQPGYIYTNMNEKPGIYSLRKGMIRASNIEVTVPTQGDRQHDSHTYV